MSASPSLFVISAPSGAGKTTLCRRLLKDHPELVLSISSTTRAPRGTEKHGKDYFFLTRKEFEAKIAEGLFAEWALVHENYYGTSREVLETALQAGRSVLLDIDVQGAASLRKTFPEKSCLIFIAPPSLKELENRLRQRATDSEASIQKRLRNAEAEMKRMKDFDHIVINDSFDQAYANLLKVVLPRLGPKS